MQANSCGVCDIRALIYKHAIIYIYTPLSHYQLLADPLILILTHSVCLVRRP